MATEEPKPPYRRETFTHSLNLAFLALVGVAGLFDHNLWLMALPVQAAILWIVPDLPPFRRMVDAKHGAALLREERAYYLEQLWGLTAAEKRRGLAKLRGWFVEEPAVDPDDRVIERTSREFEAYREMRAIVGRLRELVGVRGVHVNAVELSRCEQVITGYLRLLIACRPLQKAVAGKDLATIDAELARVDARMAEADGPLRSTLTERRQLLAQQRERLPRLEATLELFHARAEAIVHQLRNIHGQVLADPGMNVNELLDDVMVRHEAIADPLSLVDSEEAVEAFLKRPAVQAKLRQAQRT